MKRITLFVISLLLFCTAGAFAQKFENESEIYPKTLHIGRIYNHSKGFRVDYIRQDYTVGSFWAPIEWFRGTASTGEITYGESKAYPYVTFYYKDGAVDHFRLYLIENPAHESWGSLDPGTDYSDRFPSADSKPEISY
ncbi:MAG: hypothetical protein KAH21_12695 [Spirochaetaceae bacterium]|nr:hypothetical protein [Spirochaetaceae bacterium]